MQHVSVQGTLLLVTALGAVLLSGCVHTTPLPARQLKAGETVISGGLNASHPASTGLFGQVTTRAGKGDLSANLSVTPSFVAGGLAARRYLSPTLNAEGQLRVGALEGTAALLAVGGIQSVPTGQSPFYVGAHAGLTAYDDGAPLLGGSIGLGDINLGSGWRMQIELEATANFAEGELQAIPAPNRLSIGVFRHLK